MADSNPLQAQIADLQRKIAQREKLLQDSPDEDVQASLDKLKAQLNQLNADTILANTVVVGNLTNNYYSPPPAAPVEDLEQTYLKGLRKRLTRLPLGDSDDDAQGVTLESVYIALDTTTQVELTEVEQQAYKYKWQAPKDRPLTAQEAVSSHERVVLLGDPGSGKSSFVNQLAAALATARLKEKQKQPGTPPMGLQTGWLPVVVTLRDLIPKLATLPDEGAPAQRHTRLCDVVWAQWMEELAKDKAEGFRGVLESKLEAGEAVLIFDGLDEVAEATRVRVRQAVGAVLHEYPHIARVIITCRTRSYQDGLFPRYSRFEVAKFDQDKIRAFVTQWYAVRTDKSDAEAKAAELSEAVLEPSLRELAENPMLLTTMALLHSRDQGRLPKDRAKLYDRAVGVLLERWQKKGIPVSDALKAVLSDTAKLREMLRELAYRAHTLQQQQREADLERRDLLVLLEEPRFLGAGGPVHEFLDYIDQRSGLLIGLGGDETSGLPKIYRFPHRTFQEYLAGCWLVAERLRITRERYEQCAQSDDYWTLAAQLGAEDLLHNRDRKTDVADLAYKLRRENPATAQDWRCTLWSGKLVALLGKDYVLADADGGENFLNKLLAWLNTLLTENKLPARERVEAGRLIGRLADLSDPRFAYAFDVDQIYHDLCAVPGGTFWMGSAQDDEHSFSYEKPRIQQIVAAFRMARFPITQAQYAAFVAKGGQSNELYGDQFDLPNHPVTGVNWLQAVAFCEWLTQRWRATGLISDQEMVRLPVEREWEYAARGGLDGAQYPWGNDTDLEKMNVFETAIGSTNAVGCFSSGQNAFGLEDMSGNVREWCGNKWKSNYENYREDVGQLGNADRVRRGSSWDIDSSNARCACRVSSRPDFASEYIGFRVVLSPVSSSPPLVSSPLNTVHSD